MSPGFLNIIAPEADVNWVNDWLQWVKEVVPPFCVEIVLRDGNRYYLHSVLELDKVSNTGVIRVWDLRAFADTDLEDLRKRLGNIKNRSELGSTQQVHPKLDWANVFLHADSIAYCVEWHDRLWPEEERSKIGFQHGFGGQNT